MDTFKPYKNPDQEMPVEFAPAFISHQFADAYSQDATIGINADMRDYSPRWTNVPYAEAMYIIDFLTARKGTTPFYWKPTEEGALKVFKCKKMTYKWKSGRRCSIDASFEQAAPF